MTLKKAIAQMAARVFHARRCLALGAIGFRISD
jgi:hypothetical protein